MKGKGNMNITLERSNSKTVGEINPCIPEFLKWTLLSLNLDMSTDAKWGFSRKSKNRRANSKDPDDGSL